jgi:hypothetical protein
VSPDSPRILESDIALINDQVVYPQAWLCR